MTMRLGAILSTAVVLLCLIGVARSAIRLADTSHIAASQARSLQDTAALVTDISNLQDQEQRVERQSRPEQDVIARVNAVLSALSIPQDRFSGLSPESDIPVQSRGGTSTTKPRLRRQTVRLSLRDLEVAELGQLLVEWRDMNPMWTATRIDLSHRTGRNAMGNRFDVTILLSALYLGDEESPA